MITAPKTSTCYCGCGQPTQGHWVPGHDRQAETWLDKLEGPDTIAQRVLLAGYGPSGRNLRQAAREAGLTG